MIAGLASAGVSVGAASSQESSPKAETIHEELEFKVSPHRVYEALLDSKQFTTFSGVPGEIHREAGGAFSLFDGQIMGRNVELVSDRRIVQAWRSASWPEGIYSIAKFEFEARGSGTRLVFDHTGFPPALRNHLASGWQEHYFGLLKKYFEE
jgi:activator of HSP90 ATPase